MISIASLQPHIPTGIPQHTSPPLVVPATSISQRYRFQWSHAILTVGILAASGAGTAVFFKVFDFVDQTIIRLKKAFLLIIMK